ncbi:LacI family DNA-binding transcriptional regulator [Motilibacter deserti]|uniref:LacI family transcriptional regulator n=1 Tax=Motilibacter deserti TaxID=2714956 RepID=A0ABX0GWN3_9ACTN|nr:LacI family transcriptional regulator [Motilibacter deserti]
MPGTLDDVARAAGVSRMTVSNAYNRPEKLAPATLERVLQAARELGYGGPSAVGRSLRRGRTGVLGLLLNDALPYAFTDPGAVAFMRGLAVEAAARDLSLQLIAATGPAAARAVADAVVDAFVALAPADDDPALATVLARRLPLVTAGAPALPDVPCVTIDNVAAARRAAEHLLALGHTRLAVVTWRLLPDGHAGPAGLDRQHGSAFGVRRDRLAGYRQAVERAGLAWEDVRVEERPGNSREDGYAAGDAVLDALGARGPLGVLASTDVLALGVLQAARERGARVPEDVSVVGLDDVPEAAASTPALTTVHQDLFAQGRECARRAAGALPGPVHRHPSRLVVRASTAPPGGG